MPHPKQHCKIDWIQLLLPLLYCCILLGCTETESKAIISIPFFHFFNDCKELIIQVLFKFIILADCFYIYSK